jgi:hypothetical protein
VCPDAAGLGYFRFVPQPVDVAEVPCWVGRLGFSGELRHEVPWVKRKPSDIVRDQMRFATVDAGALR